MLPAVAVGTSALSVCCPRPRRLVRSESCLKVERSRTFAGSPWTRSCKPATLRRACQARLFAGLQRAMAARVGLRFFIHPQILSEIPLAAGVPVRGEWRAARLPTCPGCRACKVGVRAHASPACPARKACSHAPMFPRFSASSIHVPACPKPF